MATHRITLPQDFGKKPEEDPDKAWKDRIFAIEFVNKLEVHKGKAVLDPIHQLVTRINGLLGEIAKLRIEIMATNDEGTQQKYGLEMQLKREVVSENILAAELLYNNWKDTL